MLRQFRIAAVVLAALASAGCGSKGPLVLPPAAPAPPSTAPAAMPSPATDPASPQPVNPAAPERKP